MRKAVSCGGIRIGTVGVHSHGNKGKSQKDQIIFHKYIPSDWDPNKSSSYMGAYNVKNNLYIAFNKLFIKDLVNRSSSLEEQT